MRCVVAICALALAGCGSDDGSGSTSSGGGGTTSSGGSAGTGGSSGGSAGASATGGSGGGSAGSAGSGGGSGCGTVEEMLPAWFRDFQPQKEIWVSPTGNDANDGSSASAALKTTSAALAKLAPGLRIDFMAGSYDCANAYVSGFTGSESAPAMVVSSDGPKQAVFDCAGGGGFLIDSSHYLGFDGIEIGNTSGHGFQVSSGSPGPWDANTISNDIVLAHSYVHHTGLASFKASQARALYVIANELAYADIGRQNVEMVAVDEAIIAGNEAHHSGQFDEVKGGGKHGRIYRNYVHDSSGGILVGGDCTGTQYLVDSGASYEASDLRVWDNVIASSPSEAFRIVDCHDCTVSNNTFYAASPGAFIRLITSGFAAPGGNCGDVALGNQNVHVENNVFAGSAPVSYAIPSNDSASALALDHNSWFAASGDINSVGSDVPFKGEASSLYVDPVLVSPPGDLHPSATSPLIGAGISEPWIRGNAEGACWTNGVDIGAY